MGEMLTTAAGVALCIIGAFSFIWALLRWKNAFADGELRSHASIWLTLLFVIASLGLIAVSQARHEFRVYQMLSCDKCPYEKGYSAWSSIRGTEYEPYRRWFLGLYGQQQADAIKARIKAELDDKRTLARLDPSAAAFLVMLAILLSPELLILAAAGGWWARTVPLALLCGLGAALVHDFLKMMLRFTEQFPSHTFPMALALGIVLSVATHLAACHFRRAARVRTDDIVQSDGRL
jgi:hypothetical protein